MPPLFLRRVAEGRTGLVRAPTRPETQVTPDSADDTLVGNDPLFLHPRCHGRIAPDYNSTPETLRYSHAKACSYA